MPRCPICRGEQSDVVHSEEVEVRDKKYRYEVRYCPSCAIKFTFYTPTEEVEPS